MSTIKAIAELAQVSVSTASFVLNGKGTQSRISPATQAKVLEAARLLGYRPNISAKRLRNSGDKVLPVIALFWTLDSRAALLGAFLDGIHRTISSCDQEYDLLIQPFKGSQLRDVRSLIIGTRFNGAVIANLTEEDQRYLESVTPGVPVVLYQRSSTKYSCVNIDNYRNGSEVARLFANRGHRCVGIVLPEISSVAVRLRKEGFLDAARELGLEVGEHHIVCGSFSEQGGYDGVNRLLQHPDKPTALFSLSDQMSVGALAALHEAGIRVPEQFELVSHDNYDIAKFTRPALTTMDLPIEEMAGTCLDILLDLMHRRMEGPVSRQFESRLIVRQSCGGFVP